MGTNLSLADIKKITYDAIYAYRKWEGASADRMYPQEELEQALVTTLKELHLTTLANDLLHEIKNVRGD